MTGGLYVQLDPLIEAAWQQYGLMGAAVIVAIILIYGQVRLHQTTQRLTAEATAQNHRVETERQRVENDNAALINRRYDELVDRFDTILNAKQTLEREFAEYRGATNAEIRTLKAETVQRKQQYEEAALKLRGAEMDAANFKRLADDTNTEMNKLNSRYNREMSQVRDRLGILEEQFRQKQAQLDAEQSRRQGAEKRLAAIQREHDELKAQIELRIEAAVSDAVAPLEKRIEQLTRERDELCEYIKQIQASDEEVTPNEKFQSSSSTD